MFINLHEHTHYSNRSFRDAISKVEDLIDYNHQLGNLGTCITEHDCVSSAIQAQRYFFKQKEKDGWENDKLLLGNEIYLCPNGMDKESENKIFPHFLLIALDEEGHKQIRVLSTRAWERAFKWKNVMRVPTYYADLFEVIGDNPGHVVASTACIGGMLGRKLMEMLETGRKDIWSQIISWLSILSDLFGENHFFLEMQPAKFDDQKYVNSKILELSQRLNIPYIITTDVHYIKKEDAPIHTVFIKSQDGDRETDRFYATTYCMNEAEIHEYLDNDLGYDVVQRGLDNTKLVYDMAQDYDLRKPLRIPYMPMDKSEPNERLYQKYVDHVPLYQYLHDSPYDSDRHLLRELLKFMEEDEYSRTDAGYQSISECLNALIQSSEKMNQRWSAYLMNMKDYVQICWDSGSFVGPGRGSVGGFRLAYMLGITQIDPLREGTPLFYWRFLNPERASVLDIDIDVNPNKKDAIVAELRKRYTYATKVATFGTEKARSAIQTAARGLGYNDDYALYLGGMVVADRGQPRNLSQMYYGDEDHKPDQTFVQEMNAHPDLWEAAQKIEGLIKGCGSHAGGVIISDEPFTETAALMKTNSGEVITQFDLHDAEELSLIKIDLLVTDFIAKESETIDLLLKYNKIAWQGTLKDTYKKYLEIYSLERTNPDMWKLLWDKKIYSFFQMEKESGVQAIALTKPSSVEELTVINSVMRLMAQNEGDEIPLEKYARFKADISLWYQEMTDAGLTPEEQKLLEPVVKSSYGICESQEKLMMLPQIPEVGGYSLKWVDMLRKSVSKKQPKQFMKLEEEFFQNMREKHLSEKLCKYVWYVLIYMQRGYGFPAAHAVAYSECGLQCLNLCWQYPIIYWNTACLIVDSGALEDNEDNAGGNYGKISTAIANMQKSGITIALPEIDTAEYGFVPDETNNQIIFSLKAISGVGDDVARSIIQNRPFSSMRDFYERMVDTKIITPVKMQQLIKAGCFTILDNPDRKQTMRYYLEHYQANVVDKLTMVHVENMRRMGLIRDPLMERYARVPAFVKYVTQNCRVMDLITDNGTKRKLPKKGYFDRTLKLDNVATTFFLQVYTMDSVVGVNGVDYMISEQKFIKESEKYQDKLREWMNRPEIIRAYNEAIFNEQYGELMSQSVSEWEMNSVGYYYSGHELENVQNELYGIEDYFSMPEEPVAYDHYSRWINGERKWLPKFKISRIAGTVVDSNNDKHTVTLLTVNGIVNVKLDKGRYVHYNQKLSTVDEGTGKKTKVEDSWFTRGTKIVVCGYRKGFNFRAYKYADTIYTHIISKITKVNADGTLELKVERGLNEDL